MFELFPEGPVHEYPDLVNVGYSFVWAFVFASCIAITHRLTFNGENYPKNFFQSLVLGAIVTTMVMMAIGDSLARGLGVFGAMAIIRFRTRIDDPRDVLFLFAALSTGLCIGVFGFTISFAGTLLFCLVAFVLHVSPFRTYSQKHRLTFLLEVSTELPKVEAILTSRCDEFRQVSVGVNAENLLRYEYSLAISSDANADLVFEELRAVSGIRQIKIILSEFANPQ